MQEREISLLDAVIDVLFYWRSIILAMLIGALVFGGFGYLRSYLMEKRTRDNLINQIAQKHEEKLLLQDENARSLAQEQMEEMMTETQKMNVISLVQNEEIYSYRKRYIENSVLMNIDATSMPQTSLVYAIVADDNNRAIAISSAYKGVLKGNVTYAKLVAKLEGRTETELSELIEVKCMSENIADIERQSMGVIWEICIYEEDERACKQLADAVVEYIESMDMTEFFGDYKIILLENSCGKVLNKELLEQQVEQRSALIMLRQEIGETKKALTNVEMNYYQLLSGNMEDDEKNEQLIKDDARGHISIKYVIMGAMTGAFLVAGVLFVAYILTDKLHYDDDITFLYDITLLGKVPVKDSSKRLCDSVDKWLRSLKNGKMRQFSREDSVRLAAVALKMEAIKEGYNKVYCIGCELQQGADQVCGDIAEILKKDNLVVKSINNILYDIEAREKLQDAQAVVLVEKAGVTMRQEIVEELDLLKRQRIAVLGSIVVE